jgi:hypothetical protein
MAATQITKWTAYKSVNIICVSLAYPPVLSHFCTLFLHPQSLSNMTHTPLGTSAIVVNHRTYQGVCEFVSNNSMLEFAKTNQKNTSIWDAIVQVTKRVYDCTFAFKTSYLIGAGGLIHTPGVSAVWIPKLN